jgi:8-oxo-dGTP diphosphatase
MDSEFRNYQLPAIAVDIVLFRIKEHSLQVGLIKRTMDPHKHKYVLPGRFVRYGEPLTQTFYTVIEEKCGLEKDSVALEQLYTFGDDMARDTRIRTVSVVYYAVVNALTENNLSWFSIDDLPPTGFDHKKIILYAHERLKNKVLWDEFAFHFLSKEFTLTELQQVYESVLQESIDKRNFRKKIITINGLKKTNQKKTDGVHRPALLYTYKSTRKPLI